METVLEEELITQNPAFKPSQNIVQESFTAATMGGEVSANY